MIWYYLLNVKLLFEILVYLRYQGKCFFKTLKINSLNIKVFYKFN